MIITGTTSMYAVRAIMKPMKICIRGILAYHTLFMFTLACLSAGKSE